MRGPNTGGHEGDSKLRKEARQPRGPRMSLYRNLLGASRYSRHPRGPPLVAAPLCTCVRLAVCWGPPKTAGLGGTRLRWAEEGLTEEPWSARRSGKGRGACDLSGPG